MNQLSISIFLLLFGGAFTVQAQDSNTGDAGYFITSRDGTKLYVEEHGKGAPVIFLSGGPGLNPDYLQPVWSRLVENHRCIVLHQRGTGKSVIPVVDAASMSMDNYVNDLEALRQRLHLDKLVLAGHSWGGMLAMLYLSKQPEHVEKLVLLDSGPLTMGGMQVFMTNMGKNLNADDQAELKRAEEGKMPQMKAIWPGYFYHRERALATRHLAEGIVGQEGVNGAAMANYFAGSEAMIATLKKVINTPVILIKGKDDPMDESVSGEIKSALPQTVIHEIDECGHLPWMENPEQITRFFSLLQSALE